MPEWLANDLIQAAMYAIVFGAFLFFFDVQIKRRRR